MDKQRIKGVAIAVLAVLAIIIVSLNMQNVSTNLLITKVSMPRAVLLFIVGAIGFAAGSLWATKRKK